MGFTTGRAEGHKTFCQMDKFNCKIVVVRSLFVGQAGGTISQSYIPEILHTGNIICHMGAPDHNISSRSPRQHVMYPQHSTSKARLVICLVHLNMTGEPPGIFFFNYLQTYVVTQALGRFRHLPCASVWFECVVKACRACALSVASVCVVCAFSFGWRQIFCLLCAHYCSGPQVLLGDFASL